MNLLRNLEKRVPPKPPSIKYLNKQKNKITDTITYKINFMSDIEENMFDLPLFNAIFSKRRETVNILVLPLEYHAPIDTKLYVWNLDIKDYAVIGNHKKPQEFLYLLIKPWN